MPAATIRPRAAPLAAAAVGCATALAALTALVAGCAAPSATGAGSPGGAGTPSASAASRPVARPALPTQALRAALGCPASMPIAVQRQLAVAARTPSVVVVARCVSSAGSPPTGVFVVTGTVAGSGTGTAGHGSGAGRIGATLVGVADQVDVRGVTVTGSTVHVRGLAYSGPDVPRCCPDRPYDRSWTAQGDRFVVGARPTVPVVSGK